MTKKHIIFIVGPTGVGKTKVGFSLAQKLDGEIVSCDAMQVYKEVSIASNKPPRDMLRKIPHHLVGIVSISRTFDVAAFRKKAVAAIHRIHKKGKIPVVIGGSGLYMSVLLDGIFKGPGRSNTLRVKLEKEVREKGSVSLYKRLRQVDPLAAQKIHPNDTKRIIRALEVFMAYQTPISHLQKNRKGLWTEFDITVFAVNRERDKLYDMINRRVDEMVTGGLIEEIKSLSKKRWSQTAHGIIGVKEITGYLKGEYNLDRAKYLMKLNTRHYAKRQLTWFRRDKRIKWINTEDSDTPSKIAEKIIKKAGYV